MVNSGGLAKYQRERGWGVGGGESLLNVILVVHNIHRAHGFYAVRTLGVHQSDW